MTAQGESSIKVLLRLPAFRRMWFAIATSSLGDWLGLLATTAFAAYLTRDASNLIQGAAVSGVLVTRLLPDLILGPIAGALVDRFDRRAVAIIGDTLAGGLYLSIALAGNLTWLLVAQFLVEGIGLFTNPAKQALWVNIVPRERLAVANQLNYVSIYGMVPVAALVFALLATFAQFLGAAPVPEADEASALISGASVLAINVALVIDAASYLAAATVLFFTRHLIPSYLGERPPAKSIFSLIKEGVGFVKNSKVMRAIYIGILGAFGAGGLVAGVAQAWVSTMGGGNAGYGILFGAVFTGVALGMLIGPKVLPTVPRRMVFTMGIGVAGIALVVMSVIQGFVGAAIMSVVMGLFAGIAWITGFTMIGHEVSDHLRGRVFAFVMSSVRLTLLATIAVGPILANGIGYHAIEIGAYRMVMTGPGLVLAASGLLTVAVAVYAGRQVGGLRGEFVRKIVRRHSGSRRRGIWHSESGSGVLIAVEGVDGPTVDLYRAAVVDHVRRAGYAVAALSAVADLSALADPAAVIGHTAGASPIGLQPEPDTTGPAAGDLPGDTAGENGAGEPAIALRILADLANAVATRVRPALAEGRVVVCSRYIDAVVVGLSHADHHDDRQVRSTAQWACTGADLDLTVLVLAAEPDDGEASTAAAYRARADAAPEQYIAVPIGGADADITSEVTLSSELIERIDSLLRQRTLAREEREDSEVLNA